MNYSVDLYDHQKKAVALMANGKILWGGVGSGKSRVALAYYVKSESPRNIIVITTAKKRDSKDWEGEAAKFVIGSDEESTLHGILTVDSWNNIGKYVNTTGCFFIFDEQRLVGSGSWVKAFLKIVKCNHWVLLSATPGDTWLDYAPVFIANGFYKNRTQFKREHVVYAPYVKFPKVLRYINEGKLIRLREELLIQMKYKTWNERHDKTIWCDYDKELTADVRKRRWHPYEDRPLKDVAEMFMVMRQIAYSDPSRNMMIHELLKKHPRLIIFYNFNYELENLRKLASEVKVAEWNGHKHEPLPDDSRWVYLVQYLAGSEGWNAIETNVVVFNSMTYSYKLWEQAHGRIDRLDTPFHELYYYNLRSKAPIDDAVWGALKVKKSFQTPRNWE